MNLESDRVSEQGRGRPSVEGNREADSNERVGAEHGEYDSIGGMPPTVLSHLAVWTAAKAKCQSGSALDSWTQQPADNKVHRGER